MEEFKIVVLGDEGVGKTALTIQFVQHIFLEEYDPTIEERYRKVDEFDDKKFNFEILDTTAFEDYYGSARDTFMKASQGFLLVYSITSRSCFENINGFRGKTQRAKGDNRFSVVLVGNKCDLESERQVSTKEGQDLARSFGCPFFETSAKSNTKVENAFRQVAKEYIKQDLTKGEAGRPAGLPKAKDCLIM